MFGQSILKIGAALKRAYFPDAIPRNQALDPQFLETYVKVRPHTMTSWERLNAAYESAKYVVEHGISGAIVECGVWKGGSSMMLAETLRRLGDVDRELYLFDTFAGMTEPTAEDGGVAHQMWAENRRDDVNLFCYAPLEEVRRNLASTGYPPNKVHFVKGSVENTIPKNAPDSIAILRLDTDWYQSTLHELTHLYPRLTTNGVLIVDDYGFWQGARRAVDEYFAGRARRPLLARIDDTGRIGIKTASA